MNILRVGVIFVIMGLATALACITPTAHIETSSYFRYKSPDEALKRAITQATLLIRSNEVCKTEFSELGGWPNLDVPVFISPWPHPQNPRWIAWTSRSEDTDKYVIAVRHDVILKLIYNSEMNRQPGISELPWILVHEYVHANVGSDAFGNSERTAQEVTQKCKDAT